MEKRLDLEKILIKEVYNKDRIYLYKEDDHWCAHDHSALYLQFLHSQVALTNRIHHMYEIILKCVTLNSVVLESLVENSLVRVKRSDEIELRIPDEKMKEFEAWKSAAYL